MFSISNSYAFLSKILDSVTDHIVVIDETGEIQYVNKSWSTFGNNNACIIGIDWSGVNYIEECDKGSEMGDEFSNKAGAGIRSVIENRDTTFYLEYPCNSPDEKRWFMMSVTHFQISERHFFVISHKNISERKLAEEEVNNLARIGGLTNIPNRRTFDSFIHEEWNRCNRLRKPICLAIVDLDYFKLLNDDYGHQTGDECLIRMGELLKEFVNRPSDICARYGGEEFALVWADTPLKEAKLLCESLLTKVVELNIPNKNSPTSNYLTASIGLAEMIPTSKSKEHELIGEADRMLYRSKASGRNKVSS